MVKSARREYLETIRKRYRKARKKDKKPILDEFCTNCGYHRKYAIRLLSLRPRLRGNKPGAKPIYDSAALLMALKRIWFATDQMCSKKLKAAIFLWLPHYEQEYGALPVCATTQLLAISARSIDRLLQPVRAIHPPWAVRHQAWHLAQKPDLHSHRALGCHPTRLHGSRYGSALRQ